MSHWFHRNPLKATKGAKFELKGAITNADASKICSELRLRREQLVDMLSSASALVDLIESQFEQYLKMLYGFIRSVEPDGSEGNTDNPEKVESKLRYLGKYTWANSVLGGEAYQSSDSWFELLNMCCDVAIWYMKRAASLSAKDEVSDLDAKKIHTALRTAAGIFQYIISNREKVGIIPNAAGNDLDERVLNAYYYQCIAEAQEVAIARAIELKHSPSLVSNLAAQTAQLYETCEKYLHGFDTAHFDKWNRYFQLKHHFYLTYAYAYLCEHLLTEDKCGPAIRAYKEGFDYYEKTGEFCAKYAKASGPGFIAKPESHLFYRRIVPILKRHKEKADRENQFIYHDTVPSECPTLKLDAEFGVAKPIEFVYPLKADSWTIAAYNAFDITKVSIPDFKLPQKHGKLPPVKESKVYETDRDPSNISGCVLS